MPDRVAVGTEVIRIFVLTRVPVRRTPRQQHERPRRDHGAANGIIDARCAANILDRRRKAKLLLDRRRDQFRPLREDPELVWPLRQRKEQGAEQILGRLVTRDQQQQGEEEQFLVAEPAMLGARGESAKNGLLP